MYLNLNLRLIRVGHIYIKSHILSNLILFQILLVGAFDFVSYPASWRISEFVKFNGDDSRTTWEYVSQYILQLGEAGINDTLRIRLFSLSLTGTAFSWFPRLCRARF